MKYCIDICQKLNDMIKSYTERINKPKSKSFALRPIQDKAYMTILKVIVLIFSLFVTVLAIRTDSPFLAEILICEAVFIYAFVLRSISKI